MKNNIKCPVGTQIQTLVFSKDNFTEKSAKNWAEQNNFKYGKVDTKENTLRLRQHNPFEYKRDSFRTIELTDGVKAVIGCPINKTSIKKPKVFDNGGGVNNYTEAEKWWGNDLSLNEQKEYAKKHLKSFEYSELLGDTAKYSKRGRRQKFINEIWEKEGSPKSILEGLYSNGGGIDSNWGNDGSTPSNNKDYNALYEMFPDNHTEAKAIWEQLSEKQKEGFLYDLRVTDAGSEHIEESWLEFVKASSYEDWLENATNWDEFKNGGGVPDGVHKIKKLLKKDKIDSDDVSPNFVNDFAHKHGIKNLTSEQVVEISNTYDNGGGVGEDKTRIANEIVKQLGGMGRLNIMTGAYNFIALPNGVSFRIKNPKANYVKVILNSMDEYDVEIGRIRGDSYKIVSEIKGIDVSGLKGFIERGTGMYLSLSNGGQIYNGWEKQPEWHGNPSLGLDSYKKIFTYGYSNRKIPVYIFGKEGSGKDTITYGRDENGNKIVTGKYDFPDWQFVVSAGASSDLSHSGGFYPQTPTLKEAMDILDEKYSIGKLIYENGGGIDKNIERKLKIGDKIIYSFGSSSNHYPIKGEVESIEGDNIFIIGDTPRSLSIDKSLVQKIISNDEYSKFNNGGGVEDIEESLNKLIEKADNEVVYLKERKNDLENNRVRPSKIIGTGFKPQYARKLAFEWLNEQILKNEEDLLFKQGLLKSLKEGKNIILYNLEGKGVIREVEQEGYVTVYYINGMHSAYKRETLDKIKSELNAVVEEVKPEYKFNVSEKVSIIDEPSSNKNNYFEVVGHENYNETYGWETKIKNINTGETVTMFENLLEKSNVLIPVNLPTRAETIEAIDGLTVMLDIEPDNNEYKLGIERLNEYLNSLPKESFADLNNPERITGFIYRPTGDYINTQENQAFQVFYNDKYPSGMPKISHIQLWGKSNEGKIYKLKSWNGDVVGALFSNDNEVSEKFEEGAEVLVGGKADYMSLVDIAEMHKVSLDHILRQAKMGMNVEREHTNDTNKIVEIVKDHLFESPDYYTKLQKIESSFENGGGVEGYWIDVPSNLKDNFFALASSLGYTQSDLANLREAMLKQDSVKEENGVYRYVFSNEMDLDKAIVILNKIQNPDYRNDMPKNLNQLKNYIDVGKLLRVSFNKNRPDWVGNIKVVVQTQTNGFYMKDGVRVPSDFNPNDFKNKSWIEYPKSNFITFSPFGFTIYAPDIRDKSKLVKWLQYEYVVGEQLEIANNTEQSDTFLYNNAVKMMEFVDKVHYLSDTITFRKGGELTPSMFNNKLEYNFDKESVSCFINAKNTGRMLVLRRANEDYKGCWSLMSGGVDLGEVPDETIKREIQEELGVNLNYDTLNYINATKHPERTHHYFELTVNEEFEPILNPENDAYMWINMSELPKNTHPLLIKYIKSDILV